MWHTENRKKEGERIMNYDEESYNNAINEQWEKLAQAQTKEEIQAVLDTWPVKSDYEIKEEVKKEPKINWISDWSEEQIEEWRKKNTNEG